MHRADRAALAEKSLRGQDGFEKFYGNIYGERWQRLRTALLAETKPVAFYAGGSEKYFLDVASITAASTLPLENATDVLDMCAAPGGKTLVLASRMKSDAHLTSNDRAMPRVRRLEQTCDSCLPPEVRARVSVTCSDAAKLCKTQNECYDAILLDAPCSSERHVLKDAKELAKWSPARIRQVATLQWSLLSCAFRLLKSGGFLLYSTCAICDDENDKMISRLLERFPTAKLSNEIAASEKNLRFADAHALANESASADASALADASPIANSSAYSGLLPLADKTRFGNIILPDASDGAGPIYFSLIKKAALDK